MPQIHMIALKPLTYAGKRFQKDDPFIVRGESDARVLAAIKSAVYSVQRPAPVAPVIQQNYRTRAMVAAAPAMAPALADSQPEVVAPKYVIKVDGEDVALDGKDADELRALCTQLGVSFHHLAGERKLRETLAKSQAAE